MKLKYTRAIIDAIHSGELSQAETAETAIFKLQVCVRHQPCYSWWACRRSSTASIRTLWSRRDPGYWPLC